MINVTAQTPVEAWKECLTIIYQNGNPVVDNPKLCRDEVAIIEIQTPCIQAIPKLFPMTQHDIDIINRYIVTGENENEVVHEWTKLYYHRIYDQPNSQYEFLLKKLSSDPQSGRAQISMWDKRYDQEGKIAPCTQIIWVRQKNKALEMHVHAASVDIYKKFLMNQQEFITLQIHLANKLEIKVGKFYHLIDSCHIHAADEKIVENMLISL